jgi:DNA repair protein RecO
MSQSKEYLGLLVYSQDYKDYDKHIKLLTADKGMMTCLLRGVKKPAAKLKAAGMPFACGIYTILDKSNVVTGFLSMHEFDWIVKDYDTYIAASVGCEVAMQSSLGSENDSLLNLLFNFFKNLLTDEINFAFKNYLNKMLSYLGYKKNYDRYSIRQLIDELEQRLSCKFNSASLIVE